MKPGKRKSNKIRALVRQDGWTLVKIQAVSGKPDPFNWDRNTDNTLNYEEMMAWCQETFERDTWLSSLHSYVGNNSPGTRRFVFEREADASLFALRWL